jgi:hypothetical protein
VTPAWATVRTALIAWAVARAGVASNAGRWADEELAVIQTPSIELSVVSMTSRGTDETVFDLEDGELVPTTGGHRELVLQVAVDSDSQELGDSATVIAERFRTRATGPVSLEQLEAVGLGMLSVGSPIQYAVRDAGGRAHSRAVVEVRLSFVSAEADDPIQFIETVHATGTATRPDDTTITVPVVVTS